MTRASMMADIPLFRFKITTQTPLRVRRCAPRQQEASGWPVIGIGGGSGI